MGPPKSLRKIKGQCLIMPAANPRTRCKDADKRCALAPLCLAVGNLHTCRANEFIYLKTTIIFLNNIVVVQSLQ